MPRDISPPERDHTAMKVRDKMVREGIPPDRFMHEYRDALAEGEDVAVLSPERPDEPLTIRFMGGYPGESETMMRTINRVLPLHDSAMADRFRSCCSVASRHEPEHEPEIVSKALYSHVNDPDDLAASAKARDRCTAEGKHDANTFRRYRQEELKAG